MSTDFLKGFASINGFSTALELKPTTGQVPEWLSGSLIRNGPALFDAAQYKFRHYFDGMAMLHKFDFSGGRVFFTNKMLNSQAYQKLLKDGRLYYREFATEPDRSFFDIIWSLISPSFTDNASVNVAKIGGKFATLSDGINAVEFDPTDLSTVGTFKYDDKYSGMLTSPHPHYDYVNDAVISYFTNFSLTSSYNVYAVQANSTARHMLTQIKTKAPAYMHSFGLTPNYIILAEFPLRATNLLYFFTKYQQPMLNDFDWTPQDGTRFLVINRKDYSVKTWQSAPFMTYHHINAYEKNGDLIVDVSAYDDANLFNYFFYDALLGPKGGVVTGGQVRRYHLRQGTSDADCQVLSPHNLDLPRINYWHNNGLEYQYVYGLGFNEARPGDLNNQLVKIDVKDIMSSFTAKTWGEPGLYPNEPMFVPKPGATAEDEGVVLSVVIDTINNNSFLLILDGQSFEEKARLPIPYIIPFGLHGNFFE